MKGIKLFIPFALISILLAPETIARRAIRPPHTKKSLKKIIPGADQTNLYIDYLKGKNIAMVINQTSVIGRKLTLSVDSLLKRGIRIKKIFGPEHGFRGNAVNGAGVSDSVDPASGLPVISLYGNKHYKPTAADLSSIDLVIFDIQDVGARFFTYLSLEAWLQAANAKWTTPQEAEFREMQEHADAGQARIFASELRSLGLTPNPDGSFTLPGPPERQAVYAYLENGQLGGGIVADPIHKSNANQGGDNQEESLIGHTVTVIYYIGLMQTYIGPGNLWRSETRPFVGHIYGEEGKWSTINVTLTVSNKAEISGYDIGTPYGIGSGTDFYEAEHDINVSNASGGFSMGYDYDTGYRTFIHYTNQANGNIQGTMTTIIPTGQQNLERNLQNVWRYLFPPVPVPIPSPFYNPVTN